MPGTRSATAAAAAAAPKIEQMNIPKKAPGSAGPQTVLLSADSSLPSRSRLHVHGSGKCLQASAGTAAKSAVPAAKADVKKTETKAKTYDTL